MIQFRKYGYLFFYITIFIILVAIIFSNPFLRYPYDMIHHLMVIDDMYMQLLHPVSNLVGIGSNDIYVMIPTGSYEIFELARPRFLWHYIWVELFIWFDIDSTQLILRAKIIHVIQTLISLVSMYYFSHVVLRNIFKHIDKDTLKWFSLWSVGIWLTIFATFSVAYHQVWILWYSVNYQITLPLFWYMLGLTLVLVLEETSWKVKLFFILQIIFLSRFMLQVHSMEFLYYFMHIFVFGLVFIDKIYFFVKRYFYMVIPTVLGMVYMIQHYQPEKSLIFQYFSLEKLPALYEKIMHEGTVLLSGYNRASASINEMMYVIGLCGGLFLFFQWYVIYYKKEKIFVNIRMLIFITLTSLFVLIPVYQFTGGLFSVITSTMVVNRFYYSASLFVVLPIVVYGILCRYKIKLFTINIVMFSILIVTGMFSKYNDVLHHNFYKNVVSIQNSFSERKVGFNLSDAQIKRIGQIMKADEKNNKTSKEIYYYARADIAFVIKYLYHKNVYWEGRYKNSDYVKIYEQNKYDKDYHSILFEIPKNFPQYEPFT